MSMAAMGWARMLKGMGRMRKESATWHTSRFIRRRNSTTFTAVAEEVEKDKKEGSGKNEDKSLYLCFKEYKCRQHCWTYSLQSIGLSHLLRGRSSSTDISGNGDHNSPLVLQESAFRGGSDADVPEFLSVSPNLGSKFIFTSSSSSAQDGGIVKWVPKTLKPNPYLLEVDGKIFRFRFRTDGRFVPFKNCESFEVFDPNDSQWLPVELPPCDPDKADSSLPHGLNFEHAVAGSNILRWAGKCTGVSRFDVTHPEQGWTQLNSSVGSCLWGLENAQVLFLDLHQQDHDGYLMFSYNIDSTIEIFLMSQECDSLKPMQPLQLPPSLPCSRSPEYNTHVSSSFVHLGGRKVGLVLKSSRLAYSCTIPLYDKVHIFLITFEYELITTEDALDVKTRLLTTRCLEYDPDKRWEIKVLAAQHAELIGAYVL